MSSQFQSIFNIAHEAGMIAASAMVPQPMIVQNMAGISNQPIGPKYFVSEGVCGFAWIKVPGNSGFGRWAKKSGIARASYPSGLQIWVSAFGQSMERKEAYAYAFAASLVAAGINAYAESRMD